ncbi:MAG TPA: NAD(P)/FAD-dependent oxidoreductase [Gammaproteobacteria bacterium]|nr:NAD(P)/FAD-dependent oxidoreductase [Gammaproteobacteria bacterium]
MSRRISLVGAGLGGTLAAIFLARRGLEVTLYERRPDLRRVSQPAGRSINLALANRGLKPLRLAGLERQVRKLLTVMRGRMIHPLRGPLDLQPYGQRTHEVIYSVSRPGLNALLLDAAEAAGVALRFEMRCVGVDLDGGRLEFVNEADGRQELVPLAPCIGADGAGSVLRKALETLPGHTVSEELLSHGYKELSILANGLGRHRMETNALHIWPRGGYMLIALPNHDGTFTVTLFLPHEGKPSFTSLATPGSVRDFFAREFPDAAGMIHDLEQVFFANPTGMLGTVRCSPWHLDGRALLIGDAAHAIVPFHGQGMNCAFEDCLELDRCYEACDGDWSRIFALFYERRKPNADSIADMALENYVEMRDSVRDPGFLLRQRVAFELESRFPERFSPRYSLVMFRDDIPYAEAQRRGRIQAEILQALTAGIDDGAAVDYDRAGRLITARLEPLPRAR